MDGDGIKLTRKRLQLTQAEMAGKMGVSRQSYIAWEKNVYKMPHDKVELMLAMDASVPNGGIEPKETDKQKRDRLVSEAKLAKYWVTIYRGLRAWPDIPNHNAAMRFFAKEGTTIPPAVYGALVEAFPDILADPNGDHTMSKEQSRAALGITSNPSKQD